MPKTILLIASAVSLWTLAQAAVPPLDAAPLKPSSGLSTTQGAWYPQDLTFTSKSNKANPYMDVTDFKATFNGPGAATVVVPGFYVGNQVWKIRFSPTGSGAFTYVTSSVQDPSLDGLTGTVPAGTANPNYPGPLKVDPAYPHHYIFPDGTHYFQMGYEIDWLGLLDFGDPKITKAATLIDMLAANGFTEVNMMGYAYKFVASGNSPYDFSPPARQPWQGTSAMPDYTRLNESYWQNFDNVIAYLFKKGIRAHIFVYYDGTYGSAGQGPSGKGVFPPKQSAEEDMYFKYLISRYQAYSHVDWDFMKESFIESRANKRDYLVNRLKWIKANDGYRRLLTLNCPGGAQSQFRNVFDDPSNAKLVDFYCDEHDREYAAAIAARNKWSMPYLNAETSKYQIGNDGAYAYSKSPKEQVFAPKLEVLMAGGYFSYYYSLHAFDVVRWNETPNGIGWYKNLASFMKTTGWYKMQPNDGLIGGGAVGTHCLANPGMEYIVYKSGSGSVTLNIADAAAPLAAKWIDLYTGRQAALPAQPNGSHTYANPWSDPAFLYLLAP